MLVHVSTANIALLHMSLRPLNKRAVYLSSCMTDSISKELTPSDWIADAVDPGSHVES